MNEEMKELVEELQEFVHKGQKLVHKAQQKMGKMHGNGYQRIGQNFGMANGQGGSGQTMGQAGGLFWGNQPPMETDPYQMPDGRNNFSAPFYDPRYM